MEIYENFHRSNSISESVIHHHESCLNSNTSDQLHNNINNTSTVKPKGMSAWIVFQTGVTGFGCSPSQAYLG